MNIEEINLIFKEKAKEVFNGQEEKYSRKRKYEGLYCCSEVEIEQLENVFQQLLEKKEEMDYETFSKLIEEGLGYDY